MEALLKEYGQLIKENKDIIRKYKELDTYFLNKFQNISGTKVKLNIPEDAPEIYDCMRKYNGQIFNINNIYQYDLGDKIEFSIINSKGDGFAGMPVEYITF